MIRAARPRVPFAPGAPAALLVIVAFGWLLSIAGLAEALEFTKIVDPLTPIPGQPGSTFSVFATPPAYDGSKGVFAAQPGIRQLWTADPDGSGFTKLADCNDDNQTQINAGETPTFAIVIFGDGVVPINPATNRILVRFKDAGNVTRGSTSVAVMTQ